MVKIPPRGWEIRGSLHAVPGRVIPVIDKDIFPFMYIANTCRNKHAYMRMLIVHTVTHERKHTHKRARAHTRTHARARARAHTRARTHTHTHTHARTHARTYTHTHTQGPLSWVMVNTFHLQPVSQCGWLATCATDKAGPLLRGVASVAWEWLPCQAPCVVGSR